MYADAGAWQSASRDDRYRLRILAAAERLQDDPVFSHETALRLHGLPALRPWPDLVHVVGERRTGGRSGSEVARHCVGLDAIDVVRVGGLYCTSAARTALDIALSRTFAEGVVVADAVFARFPGAQEDFEDLVRLLEPGARGIRRARRVLAFATPLAQSPGESWSRVLISELGFAAPDLQAPIYDGRRCVAVVDFEWAADRIVGEFDGEVKYRREEYRMGRSPEQVVIDEKNRENAIRRTGRQVVRWTWDDLRDRRRLDALLVSGAVPRRHPD